MKCPRVPHRKLACNSTQILYIHGHTRDRFYTIARFLMIWLVCGLYVQYNAHLNATGIPGMVHMQPLHHRKGRSVLFPVWLLKKVRATSCQRSAALITFATTARVNFWISLSFSSVRTFRMTTLRWSSTWTLLMVW